MLSQDWSLILSSYDRGSRFPFPGIESDLSNEIDYPELPSLPVTVTEQPVFATEQQTINSSTSTVVPSDRLPGSIVGRISVQEAGILESIPNWAKALGIGAIVLLLLRK